MRNGMQSLSLMRAALSGFLLFLTAAFFAPPGFAADHPAVVKLWDFHVHDKKFRQNIFKQFNKDNPDIKVEYTSQISDTYNTILDAAFRSGDPPDIFSAAGFASWDKLISMGWIQPLDNLAPSKEELQKWMASFPPAQGPFMEGTNVFSGKTYSWPVNGMNAYEMIFWNTKLFREAGLKAADGGSASPDTMDDVRQFAKKITELGQGKVFGIIHGVKMPGIWEEDVFRPAGSNGWYAAGRWGFNYKTGRYEYNHPVLRAYIQSWLDMKKDGSIFPGELSMDDEQAKFKFTQDLAGIQFGGYWNPGGYLAVNPDLEFDTSLPPTLSRGAEKGGIGFPPLAQTSEYCVYGKTRNPSAVWKVVTFMTSAAYQEGWVKAGGGFSVFPQYNKTEFFPHPTLAKLAQLAVRNRTFPQLSLDAAGVFSLMQAVQPDQNQTLEGLWIGQLGWDAWVDLSNRLNASFDKALAEAQKKGIKVSMADFTFPDWDPLDNYPPSKKK